MELYKEILVNLLKDEQARVIFPDLQIDAAKIVESESYKALQKIKAVIENDRLDDEECFKKIEEIVCIFESLGSSGGSRHDFG